MKKYILPVLLSLLSLSAMSQKDVYKGKIVGTDKAPVRGAIIVASSDSSVSAISDSAGFFEIKFPGEKGSLSVVAEGYYETSYPLAESVIPSKIVLVPKKEVKYNGMVDVPGFSQSRKYKSISTVGAESKDLNKSFLIDGALQGEVLGLKVIKKGGMPGEGAYMNIRGIHSFIADNSPLIVINGVPYMGNQNVSDAINAYSRSLLFGYAADDIESATILKGVDASLYGSLGSNGVLLIKTKQATSDNLETRISFTGQYGINFKNKSIPVMGSSDYVNYFHEVGEQRYGYNTSLLQQDYPFLKNGVNYYSYLFNSNTDWLNEIQGNSFTTDNIFRVEGGDEIAKYNISFGYADENGVIEGTSTERYHTLINANIIASRKVDIFTNIGLSYISSSLMESGMSEETNPILASYYAMPLLFPYEKEPDGSVLPRYSSYDSWNVNKNPAYSYENVSNPLAIVNTVNGEDKIYDANIRFGLNYKANKYLTLTGLLNIYYNYTEENIFVPGVTDRAIVPQYYGEGKNAVRKGVVTNKAYYYAFNAFYNRVFNNVHNFKISSGAKYFSKNLEYDYTSGYNTANDDYQTLGDLKDDIRITGDNVDWKWFNYYFHTDYIYNNILKTTFNLAVDRSSISGKNADKFGFFPSFGVTLMTANTGLLPDFVDMFNLSAEVSRTGNSRFSSNYCKNYYQNTNFFNLGTISRSNVPNTDLKWETKDQVDLGFDLSMFSNKIDFMFNYYNADASDLLVAREISGVYGGVESAYYDNVGEIKTTGVELGLKLTPVNTKNLEISVGGTLSTADSKIESLGNNDELTISFDDYDNDDAMIIMKKGESPYQFYGYKTNGVYSSSSDVPAGLVNKYGDPYLPGDVRFIDVHEDNIINANDKTSLGSAQPDYFGSLFASVRVKKISLLAEFGYSVGNKAYNAVRRNLESMDTFHNQAKSVINRWRVPGDETNIPRASYGDPRGNNLFSDRWIEDASYLKLRSVTLSYNFNNLFDFCRSGSVFIVGENLFTITDYLGGDPEFSYSYSESMQGFDYAKVALPKTVKVGINLNF